MNGERWTVIQGHPTSYFQDGKSRPRGELPWRIRHRWGRSHGIHRLRCSWQKHPRHLTKPFEILQDPDAPQWDSGSVLLNDGYLFQLSSAISPEPVNGENESLADFTARQRVARTARINLLANRARRTRDALKAYEEANPPPVLLWKYNMVILSTKARGAFYNYDTDISMHRASFQ